MKTSSSTLDSRIAGGLLGLAVGDAAGVPFEGISRSNFKWNTVPRHKFKGFGTHKQPPGTWSDDTSMTMCLVHSIIDMNGKVVPEDVMNKFMDWYFYAQYTATGNVFDCGLICQHAIESWRYQVPIEMCARKDERANGNGALMRILPLAFLPETEDDLRKDVYSVAGLTHGHPVSQLCCTIYVMAAREMFLGEKDKEAALRAGFKKGYEDSCACHFPEIKAIEKNIHMKSPKAIKSDGYVVNTLTAAFWCFLHTNSYEKCVRAAINLGYDTDTTAAVAGGLAGIYYGFEKIPKYYLENLAKATWIFKSAQLLQNVVSKHSQLVSQKA